MRELDAISPIDGRYRSKTGALATYFSEFGLIKYRVKVEIEYLIELARLGLPQLALLSESELDDIRSISENFTIDHALHIKRIERKTNHDVKAVEYFIKDQLKEKELDKIGEFVHFGLTSQDINNTAVPLSIREAMQAVVLPSIHSVTGKLKELSTEWREIPMLARTHGQAASPTMVGKELRVFVNRLDKQLTSLHDLRIEGKFGGATGNFNAHRISYPDIDWMTFADQFLKDRLGLSRQQFTTQIEQYDQLAALFQLLGRINTICIDLCRDIWTYISMEYFRQKVVASEVGSSTMPHKVNPIDFENAEGNFGIANSLYQFLASKLPVSRMQRDLTDSTVLRNVGVPIAHSLIGMTSLLKGLNKLLIDRDKIQADLASHWSVVAEGIQSILRREGVANPYEKLKELTRGSGDLGKEEFIAFIQGLAVSEEIKSELIAITPFNYTGIHPDWD